MNINRLREFIVLSECLNYSKAANLLYLTQPVLSRHISDLEDRLGAQLFVRDTHKVQLTDIGEIAAAEFRSIIDAYDNAMKNIKSATDTANGYITVGILSHAVKPFISNFINIFEALHPKLEVDYISSDLDDLTNKLIKGDLDLAFITHLSSSLNNDFDVKHITDDQLCIIIPPGHKFEEEDNITIKKMSKEPIITFTQDTNQAAAAAHFTLFERKKLTPTISKTVNNLDSALFYVEKGTGLFIIPRHLSFIAGDLTVKPIADETAVLPLHLVWKKSNTKTAMKTFVREFSNFCKDLF